MAAAKEGPANHVADNHGEAVEASGHVLEVTIFDVGSGGRQNHLFSVLCQYFTHTDEVVEGHFGIASGDSVDLDTVSAPVIFIGWHDFADGFALAGEFDKIANIDP